VLFCLRTEAKQEERLFDETVRVRVHHVAPELPGSGIVSAAAPAGSTAGWLPA